jgi:hypothetical protein
MTTTDNEILIVTLAMLLPLTALFLWCGYRNFKHGWSDSFFQQPQPSVAPVVPIATPPSDKEAVIKREAHMNALEQIFPASSAANGNATVFCYDPESKRYTSAGAAAPGSTKTTTVDQAAVALSCSICLDDFDTSSIIMTAGCSHSYHRECILNWVGDHTDCPNCRAGIYDQEELESILAGCCI